MNFLNSEMQHQHKMLSLDLFLNNFKVHDFPTIKAFTAWFSPITPFFYKATNLQVGSRGKYSGE